MAKSVDLKAPSNSRPTGVDLAAGSYAKEGTGFRATEGRMVGASVALLGPGTLNPEELATDCWGFDCISYTPVSCTCLAL